VAGESTEELRVSGCINGNLIYNFAGQQSMWMDPLQVECLQIDGNNKDRIYLSENVGGRD
jgi:hypothetical protein